MGRRPLTIMGVRRRLANNTRRLRDGSGVTLDAAAELAGMNWRHWQKIEAGETNATLRTLVRMANALDVDIVALVEPLPAPAP